MLGFLGSSYGKGTCKSSQAYFNSIQGNLGSVFDMLVLDSKT